MTSTLVAALASFALLMQAAPPAAPPAPAPKPETPPAVEPEIRAEVFTAKGSFVMLLHTKEAPTACANFINLVQRKYYESGAFDTWTRVIRQASGSLGLADAGYGIRREFAGGLLFDRPGRVALQRQKAGDKAHPTTFFVTTKGQERWDLDLPIFATVEKGQTTVDSIAKGDALQRIEIKGDPSALLKRYEHEIAAWNKALDAALKPKPPASSTPTP